jgi:DNA-binding MarR family transcriptional regulator
LGTAVPDEVDRMIHQWARVRPDLDVSPIGVIARLARLQAIVDGELETFFAEHVVTKPTFSMLVALVRIDQPGGVSQRRLATEMQLTPGTVSARVERLVSDGLVARAPDPSDKRGSLVSLTDLGREVFEVVVPPYLVFEARLLGSLTEDERAALASLLRKLLVSFEGSAGPEGARVRLGLTLAPVHVTVAMQRAVGLPESAGLLVRSADDGSPAAAAGLTEGDVLTEAGGKPLRSVSSLYYAIAEGLPLGLLQLRVRRGVDERDVSVPLQDAGVGTDHGGRVNRQGEHYI